VRVSSKPLSFSIVGANMLYARRLHPQHIALSSAVLLITYTTTCSGFGNQVGGLVQVDIENA
jgi:hypothetical protein